MLGPTIRSKIGTDLSSRPARHKSNYPTLQTILNAAEKLEAAGRELEALLGPLTRILDEIREHARRERLNRR